MIENKSLKEKDMDGERHDSIPIEPEEASDLTTHVKMCSRRYMALIRWHNKLSRRMDKELVITWVYRAIALPGIIYIAWELFNANHKLGG